VTHTSLRDALNLIRHLEAQPRREEMLALRREGLSLQQIADRWNISRERVRQLVGNTGGGRYPRKAVK